MRRILITIFCMATVMLTYAQNKTVTGTVLDEETGEPLIGVTIMVENTSNGTITDIDGRYFLSVGSDQNLLFTYIGYKSVSIPVGTQSVIDVKLAADIEELDEIVVVGYGTQKKYDVTGAVSSIDGSSITDIPVPSFDAALQGQAAGLQVSSSGGVPGGATRILIRGTNSISAGTEPLIILDGIPIFNNVAGIDGNVEGQPQNPLAAINPADIASVEVLKDAAATAIYGSRGSNGVILISTKTGKKGKGSTSVSFTTGVTNAENLLDFASTEEWFQLASQARGANLTLEPFTDDFVLVGNRGLYSGPGSLDYNLTIGDAKNINPDLMDLALQQGSFREYNVSANRGFDKGFYYVSFNRREEDAIYRGGKFERTSIRSNVEFEPINNFKVGVKLTGSIINNDRPLIGSGFRTANGAALPFFPQFDDTNGDGDYTNDNSELFWPLSGDNITAGLNKDLQLRTTDNYRSIGVLYGQYDLPWVKGLSVRTELGYDIFHSINSAWNSELLNQQGTLATQNFRTGTVFNYNVYATFDKYLTQDQDHYLNVVAGIETTERNTRGATVSGLGDALRTDIQEPGTLADNNFRSAFAGITDDEKFRGYFGRVSYKFKDRYIINGSFRRDGSTRFPEGQRWAVFPAASIGWIISDESFLQSETLTFLKLRASYGRTGNKNVPARIGELGFIEWGFYGAGEQGIILSNLPAETVIWETTTTYEAGFDFGLFNNKISGSVGYFFMDINDLLLNAPVPASYGASPYASPSVWGNIGDMDNSGFELEISSTNIQKGKFKWTTNFNIGTNANEIKKLTQLTDGVRGGIVTQNFVANEVGGSLATFFLPRYAGLDENGQELIYLIDQETGLETGEVGVAVNSDVILDNRQVLNGKSGLPTYFGGVSNSITYGAFELSFLFTFQGGNYILDRHREANSYIGVGNQVLREVVTDSWLPNKTDAPLPRQLWTNVTGRTTTSRFLYKGDFIRLRNVQLSYNVPKKFVEKASFQSARVFVSGQNLLTITDYPGADPEVLNVSTSSEARNLTQGIVGSAQALPRVITITGGVNITF